MKLFYLNQEFLCRRHRNLDKRNAEKFLERTFHPDPGQDYHLLDFYNNDWEGLADKVDVMEDSVSDSVTSLMDLQHSIEERKTRMAYRTHGYIENLYECKCCCYKFMGTLALHFEDEELIDTLLEKKVDPRELFQNFVNIQKASSVVKFIELEFKGEKVGPIELEHSNIRTFIKSPPRPAEGDLIFDTTTRQFNTYTTATGWAPITGDTTCTVTSTSGTTYSTSGIWTGTTTSGTW